MKRTLAFIISVMMVLSLIPASLLTALANGTGTAGNYVENLSIDNAKFDDTEVPASIVADGKLDDTGWIRDQWNKVSSATGTWDVETPSHSELVYEYQIQRDHQFLYGAYSFDMQTVESGTPQTITLWLNDGTDGEAYWTQRIDVTITVNGDEYTADMKRWYRATDGKAMPVDEDDVYAYSKDANGNVTNYKYFINDKDYYVLAEAPACVAVRDTQKSEYDDSVIISDKVIVEFRTLLDVFSDQKAVDAYMAANPDANEATIYNVGNNLSERDTITHITAASFDDGGALYYPRLDVGDNNREMVDPGVKWPANSIEVSETDIMNNDGTADYNNVLPSGIDVDGVFSEGVWSTISDFCRYGWAAGGMTDDYRAEGTYGGADLATFKNMYYKDTNWGSSTGSAVSATNIDAVRFKYDIGFDSTYIYGAMVIYSDEAAVNYCGDGTKNNELTITFETPADKYSIKLYNFNDFASDDNFEQNDIQIIDGYDEFRWRMTDGTTATGGYTYFNDHYYVGTSAGTADGTNGKTVDEMLSGMSAKRVSKYLVQVAFRFTLSEAFGTNSAAAGYRFTVSDVFGNTAYSGCSYKDLGADSYNWQYNDTYCNENRKFADGLEIASGGLDQRSWPNMYAADNHVDYMVRSEASMYQATGVAINDKLGSTETYTYKLLTDYDYLYGAAVVWDTEAWEKDSSTITDKTDCFRLWINSGTSLATDDVWDITLSFYLKDTTAHTYLQGKYTPYNGGSAYMLTMHDPAGIEVAIKENPNGTEIACDGSGEIYNEYLIEFKIPLSYLMKSIEDGAPSYSDSDVTVTETVDGVEYKTTYSEAPVFNAIVSVGEWNNKFSGLFHSEIISGNNFRIYDSAENLTFYSSFPIADIGNIDEPIIAEIFLSTHGGTTANYTIDFVGWPEDSDMTFTYDQRQGTGERLDYFNLDGKLEEFFWNNEAERVKVNGGNGYWAQVPATSEDFDYEYRIYTGTENLYGAFKVNAAAVTDQTKMTIWFNVDGRDGATHKLEFWMDENTSGEYEKNDDNYTIGWKLTGPDGVEIATSGTRLSDGGHEDYLRAVMKTINDETVLEFVMDLDVLDTAKNTETDYNNYWKNFWYPTFKERDTAISNPRPVYGYATSAEAIAAKESGSGSGALAYGALDDVYLDASDGVVYYKAKAATTTSDGCVWGLVVGDFVSNSGYTVSYGVIKYYYKEIGGKTFYYSDAAMTQLVTSLSDVPTTGYFWYGDEYTAGALPQYPNTAKDGFSYVVGVSQPVGDETLTLYHNGNGEETFWVTGYDYKVDASVGLILTPDESTTTEIWQYANKYVFKSTGYDGIYQVVGVVKGAAGNAKTIAELVSEYGLDAANGDFIYVLHEGDASKQHTYAEHAYEKAQTDFAVENYIQFSNLVVADEVQYSEFAYFDSVPNTVNKGPILTEITVDGKTYEGLRGDSLGSSIDMFDAGYAPLADYRVISADEYAAKVDETYLPANGGWSSRALEVAPLLDYTIEYIYVDGDLTDNGWTEDGWIYVDSNVNSNLQTIVYGTPSGIADGDAEYTYKYQIRTDGEYIYVAAVLDVGMAVTTGDTSDPYAEPFFRIWFNNHPERDKGDDGNDYNRLTFTKRYEIIASATGSKNYSVSTPTFDARTYLGDWQLSDTTMNVVGDDVNYNVADDGTVSLTYDNVSFNVGGFSWETAEGEIDYANPSGGVENNPEVNGDNANSTVTNTYKYEDSSFFGETIITEENTTSGWGSNDKDPTGEASASPNSPSDFDDGWVAERELRKVTYGSQHATMKEVTVDGVTQTQVEFRIKLDEVTDENGEFEYTVFAGLDYGQDLVQFYPMVDKEAGIYFPSGYDRFYNPNWYWPTNHFEWNAEVERDLMLRSPYEPVVNIGSQYFEAYPYTDANEDGSYPSGLRLGGYYIQDYIHRQIRDDYGFSDYEEWDYWDVLEVGILYIPSQKYKVDIGTDDTGLKVLSPTTLTPGANDAEADNILNWQEPNGLSTCFADYQSFIYYAVIVGIPEKQVNLKYSYRCYMDYYGNDGLLNYEGSSEYPEYVDYYREATSGNLVPSYDENGSVKDEDGNLVMATIDCKGTIYMETDEDGNIIYRDADGNRVYRKTDDEGNVVYDENGDFIYVDDQGNVVENADATPLYSDFYAPVITRSSTMAKSDLDAIASYTETKGTNGYISGYTYTNTDDVWGNINTVSGALASATTHTMGDIGTFQYYHSNKEADGDSSSSSAVAGATLGYVPFYDSYTVGNGNNYSSDKVQPGNKERVEYLAAAAGYNLKTATSVDDVVVNNNYPDITNWVICAQYIDIDPTTGNWDEIVEFAEGKNVVIVYPYGFKFGNVEIPENITVVSSNGIVDPDGNEQLPFHSLGLLGVAAFTNKYMGNVNLHINYYGNDLDVVETLASKIGATMNYNNTEALEVLVLNSTDAEVVDNLISDLRDNLAQSVPTVVINAVEDAQGYEFNDPAKATLVDFDELLIDVPNIGRLLGYSSWKDENTSAAMALSGAISRYSLLKYGGEEIDLDSHEGFVKSLAFSLVSDIAYEIDFLDTDIERATSNLDVAALCNKSFATKADEIANYINCSDIISSITDTVRTDIFSGGKLLIGNLEYTPNNSNIQGIPSYDADGDGVRDINVAQLVNRVNFEMFLTDGINHAYDGAGGEVYINTALNTTGDNKVQYADGTAVLRDSTEVGFEYDYDSFGNIYGKDQLDGKVNVSLGGDLNDGYATPTIINKVLPDVITHEDFVNTGINFDLGVEANTWFAFVDDRISYYNVWDYRLVKDTTANASNNIYNQKYYDRVRFASYGTNTTVTYNGIEYTTNGDCLLWPDTSKGTYGVMNIVNTVDGSGQNQKQAYIGERTKSNGIALRNVVLWWDSTNQVSNRPYVLMYDSGTAYVVSHAALYTSFWMQVDKDSNGTVTQDELQAFDPYFSSVSFTSTNVYLTYRSFGNHFYYVKNADGTWKQIYFTFDASYCMGYSIDKLTGVGMGLTTATTTYPNHEGFSNSVSYNDSYFHTTWGQVGVQNNGVEENVTNYVFAQRSYGEIIVDLGEVKSLSALRLHLGAAANAMSWSPTIQVYTSSYTGDVTKGSALPSGMDWSGGKYVSAAFTQMDEHIYWTTASLEGKSSRYIKIRFDLNNGDVYYIDEVEVYGSSKQETKTTEDTMLVAATYNVGQLREVFYNTTEYNFGQTYYSDKPSYYPNSIGASYNDGVTYNASIGGEHGERITAGYVVKDGVITTAAEAMGGVIANLNAARLANGNAEIGVIMLQEVQQYVQQYGAMDQLKLMAKAAGYDYFYYASANEYDADSTYSGQAEYYFGTNDVYDDPTTRMDNPSGGCAIMSKYPIVAARTYYQDSGSQSIAYAQINFNGKLVDVYSAHFAANGSDRVATHDNRMDQYALLNHVLKGRNEYSVVGGDFNERYLSTYSDNVDGMKNILDENKEAYVTIEDKNGNRKVIDNILVDSEHSTITVEGIKVYNDSSNDLDKILCYNDDNPTNVMGFSDHYMAIAALTINE